MGKIPLSTLQACFGESPIFATFRRIKGFLLDKRYNVFVLLFLCKVSQPLDYCELSNRFPRDQWDSALQFFLKKQED